MSAATKGGWQNRLEMVSTPVEAAITVMESMVPAVYNPLLARQMLDKNPELEVGYITCKTRLQGD